jgi:hypothetical protein
MRFLTLLRDAAREGWGGNRAVWFAVCFAPLPSAALDDGFVSQQTSAVILPT